MTIVYPCRTCPVRTLETPVPIKDAPTDVISQWNQVTSPVLHVHIPLPAVQLLRINLHINISVDINTHINIDINHLIVNLLVSIIN